MSRGTAAASRVGLLVLVALVLAMATLFVLGDRQNLFIRKNRYTIRFDSVSGLAGGSTVQLNGVKVGSVERIVLPADMGEKKLEIRVAIDARYAQRIREDSQARIKTLGLLGDKFVELTSGSPAAPVIPPEGEIPAAPATDVDRLAETGEDVVNNIALIAAQMTSILGRLERGEGVLGKILMDVETGERVTAELDATLIAIRKAAEGLDDRRGALGRIVHDRELGERIVSAVPRLDEVLLEAKSGEGLLPSLLTDAELKERLDRVVDNLDRASGRLADVAERLDQGDTDALIDKLLRDEEFGRRISSELESLLTNLRQVAEKLNKGDGSVARLLNDPAFAEAVEDIVVGVNESKLLRWLIRSRQKKGIEKRYQQQVEELEAEGLEPAPLE
jgi:phospholipid/cholesterol/gamma-HCH transport system substrate-binding protein